MAAEIPSGIFADMFGRKLSFIASCLVGIVSGIIILASHNFITLSIGLVFLGLSTAFASGSLDALAVEAAVEQNGKSAMMKAIASVLTFQCIGLASGALAGGLLPYTEGYLLHLLIRCAVCLITICVALSLPHEDVKGRTASRSSLWRHLSQMIQILRKNPTLIIIVLCIIFVSIVQSSIEAYWQPQLTAIMANNTQTTLDILSAAAYLATTMGCLLLGRIKLSASQHSRIVYFIIASFITIFVVLLSLVSNVIAFSVIYIVLYLLIGMLSVSEQSIINSNVSNEIRASFLSISSFAARTGVLLSGILCSFFLINGSISHVWRITAVITAAGLAVIFILQNMLGHRTRLHSSNLGAPKY
jgi:MFS family permease